MTILNDEIVRGRLHGRPEFRLRLVEFLHFYGIAEAPALVAQARPAPDTVGALNVDDAELQGRFTKGVPSQDGWWQGFRSMTAVQRTFHGIASLPAREQPAWAAEVHKDGHFIAGIWRFWDFEAGGTTTPSLADFFGGMFPNFLELVRSTLSAGGANTKYEATFTLVNASLIHYAKKSGWVRNFVLRPPLSIPHLQWPVASADVGTPEWAAIGPAMVTDFTAAYGDTPPVARN
jgi:hypothetical protein